MSLKLYSPEDTDLEISEFPTLSVYSEPEEEGTSSPTILSWRITRRNGQPSFIEALHRSRLLHMHRRCHDCGRPTVQPVERDDAKLGKNRLPIPGTATVVGFQCIYCQSEWSA